MKNKWLLIILIALSGCQNQQNNVEKQMSSSQILRINNQADLTSLHPHTGIDAMCRNFQKALFEGLTRLTPEGIPELAGAEKLDISHSQTRYTFRIRPMVWTNGEEVTAFHFERTWKAAIAKGSNCLRADLFYSIKNAKKAKCGEVSLDEVGIQAVDNKTLIVDLEHPTPYFLNLISSSLFSPLYDDSENPQVFNGPFTVTKWEHDKQLVLEKNTQYWDADAVHLQTIQTTFVNDPNTVVLMYEKGEIDWVGHPFSTIPHDTLDKISSSSEFNTRPISGVYWISLNTEKFPLNSSKIRRALSVALNREVIAEHVAHGETPTKSIVPLSLSSLGSSDLSPDSNEQKSRKLFEQGLQELCITREEFPILKYSYSTIPGQKKLAEAIQQNWEKTFGIKVELIASEWNVFFSNLGERQFQIGGCIWYCQFHDPVYTLEFFKDKTHRYNSPQWESKHYQQLLDLADQEADPILRLEHLKQAELLILEEMPVIPLYMVHSKHLKSPKIQGLSVNDLGQVDFKWAYVEEIIPGLPVR